MQPDSEYQKLLSEVIKKQIVILGPDITLAKARNVPGLTIANDGTVTAISGDPKVLTQQLVDQFMELSGLIVKKTMEPLLTMGTANASAQSPLTPPTPPTMPQTPVQPMTVIPAPTTATPSPVPTPTVPPVQTTPQPSIPTPPAPSAPAAVPPPAPVPAAPDPLKDTVPAQPTMPNEIKPNTGS